MIPEPLWELMLSTNDCYPGCGCDGDYFHKTPESVERWVAQVGYYSAQQALQQINILRAELPEQWRSLSEQVNVYFLNEAEAEAWLVEWESLVLGVLEHQKQ